MKRLAALVLLISFAGGTRAGDATAEAAAKKAAEYLRNQYAQEAALANDEFKTGSIALVGLALLEAGIKEDDPALVNIAKHVRANAASQNQTYPITTAILFLDKLEEKTGSQADRALIQLLGVRLYAGQTSSGGWDYASWPGIAEPEAAQWTANLAKPIGPNEKMHPDVAKLHTSVKNRPRDSALGDNSNTQFGMIGLWVASRHGVPASECFATVESRFLKSWRQEGGWNYKLDQSPSTMPMTCAGLLGLAVGEANRTVEAKPAPAPNAPPDRKDDPFFNPPPKKAGDAKKPDPKGLNAELAKKAILGLGQVMITVDPGKPVPPERGNLYDYLQTVSGTGNLYYMLWSLERCGVAYGLDTFADVDWHAWGCGILYKFQQNDGRFSGSPYPDAINTSFAILFLMKASSFRDLTAKVGGKVKDPGLNELRGNGNLPKFVPK